MTKGIFGTPAHPQILVVDDDPDTLMLISMQLKRDGFEAQAVYSAEQALDYISVAGLPDLAVVDVNLPGMDGLTLSRCMRQMSASLPIILLSAMDEEDIVVDSLEQFAQDFMRKPFYPRELTVRVRQQLARPMLSTEGRLFVDDRLTIDFSEMELLVDGRVEGITPTETKILRLLLENPGKTVGLQELLDEIWGHEGAGESALRINIYRLRLKLEADPGDPRYVVTRRGSGYAFEGYPSPG